MAMLIPEAWDADSTMPAEKRAFYEYHASLMEPWDGPAAVAFTDGKWLGATLDRNGLRPARYLITKDGLLILASETGVLAGEAGRGGSKGRLQPGKMLLVDLENKRIVPDEEIKHALATRQPYGEWLEKNQITLDALPDPPRVYGTDSKTLLQRQRAFGYTEEDLRILMTPMAEKGEEPIGSMGTDTPLACLSDQPQPLFNYFKQLFAQVTNPAIDPIREELVMSLTSYIGTERNILEETPQHCHTLKLPHPILTNRDLEKLRRVSWGDFLGTTLQAVFKADGGEQELERALDGLCRRASLAIRDGYRLLILSDRGVEDEVCAHPESAGADRRSQSPGARAHPHAGRADHRIRRAARGDAFRAADRLWRERGQSVSGDRNAGRHGAARPAGPSTSRPRSRTTRSPSTRAC